MTLSWKHSKSGLVIYKATKVSKVWTVWNPDKSGFQTLIVFLEHYKIFLNFILWRVLQLMLETSFDVVSDDVFHLNVKVHKGEEFEICSYF